MKVEEKILIYLDTCTLMDVLEMKRGNLCSQYLLKLIGKEKNLSGSISAFTVMEFIDTIQELTWEQAEVMLRGYTTKQIRSQSVRKSLDQSELEKTHMRVLEFIEKRGGSIRYKYLSEEKAWKGAIQLLSKGNLSAPDAVHLATALETGCDALATSDREFAESMNAMAKSGLSIYAIYCDRNKDQVDFEKCLKSVFDEILKKRKKFEEKPSVDLRKVFSGLGIEFGSKEEMMRIIKEYEGGLLESDDTD